MLGLFILPLIAAIVAVGLSFVWYGPLLGKQYAIIKGIDGTGMKSGMLVKMILELVFNYITFLGFLLIMSVFQAVVIKSAIIFSIVFWLIIVAPMIASEAVWSGKGAMNSFKLFLIKGGVSLISFVVSAILFVLLVGIFA